MKVSIRFNSLIKRNYDSRRPRISLPELHLMIISPARFLVSEKADSNTSFLFRSEKKSQNVRHREVEQVQLLIGVDMPG